MKIFAKSAMNVEQIRSRHNAGCDGIEIQLLSELIDKNGTITPCHKAFCLSDFENCNISAIHAPILSYEDMADVTIESMGSTNTFLLEQIFKIANFFGETQSKKILIILHLELNMDTLKMLGILDKILITMQYMLSKYENTEVAIENVPPFNRKTDGTIIFTNNYESSNIELVQYIRNKLKTDRIGTVLDTCHVMMTMMYMEGIYNLMPDMQISPHINMEESFKKNSPVIKLVHLANKKGSGFGKGNHGAAFKEDDKDELIDILFLHKKYGNGCPITIETDEYDYMNPIAYKTTKALVDNILVSIY